MQSDANDIENLASDAVWNILDGRTADGSAPLGVTVPFKHSTHMKGIATMMLMRLLERIGPLGPEDLTALTVKFLSHAGKAGYSTRKLLYYPVDQIVDALRAKPELLKSRVGFASLVREQNRVRGHYLSKVASTPISPRRVLWSEPPFSLCEATHPYHLRQDGLTLQHCTASLTDWDLLQSLERPATRREHLFALKYWREIEAGNIRILTLMEDEKPSVTIEYAIAAKRITQMQALNPLLHDDRVLAPLCKALHTFGQTVPIYSINDLPVPIDRVAVLTIDGDYVPYHEVHLSRILCASIDVLPGCSRRQLSQLASSRHITLNLTRAPKALRNRLEVVAGSVELDDDVVELAHLKSVGGDFICRQARKVSCPQLRTIGASNICLSARSIDQPSLVAIGGNNYCPRAQSINQASLRTVGGRSDCGTR